MEISITDLLARMPIPGIREAAVRHAIAEEVSGLLGVPITTKQISFKDNIIAFQVPPVLKSAILLNAEELKKRLAARAVDATTLR